MKTGKLFTTGGSQAIRLPKEFRFPGKTVTLRRTRAGVLVTPETPTADKLRATLRKLAGSCPDFPDVPPPAGRDVPLDFRLS